MKDLLHDIVSHTQNLGFLNIVKITSSDEATLVDSIADDKSVVLQAHTKTPCAEMQGEFGMPQLQKLKYLLDGPEYREGAKISITTVDRSGERTPTGIHFENAAGDFKNDYRFMNSEIINKKLTTVEFRGVHWDVEVVPELSAIQRFNFQAGANSEHPTFLAKVENSQLKFIFGDLASHGGEFIFATNVSGNLSSSWAWPVQPILAILKIADVNSTVMSLSNSGAIMLTLDSGLAVYKYIIPAKAR